MPERVKGKKSATKSSKPKKKAVVQRPEVLDTLANAGVTVMVKGPYMTKVYWRPEEDMKSVVDFLGARWGAPLQGKQGPRKKKGLRTFQIRVLKTLVDAGTERTTAEITKDTGMIVNTVMGGVGTVRPELREAADTRAGFKSLLSLGYVEIVPVESRGGKGLTAYKATDAGKEALSQLLGSGYELRTKHPGPGKSKAV